MENPTVGCSGIFFCQRIKTLHKKRINRYFHENLEAQRSHSDERRQYNTDKVVENVITFV